MTVISISFGDGSGDTSAYTAPLAAAVAYAQANGMNVVVAAGNSGRSPLSFPANAGPPAIVVGAGNAAAGASDDLCAFSSRGALSIIAPGCDTQTGGLDTAWIDRGTQALPRSADGQGSSWSAGIVAAVLGSLRALAAPGTPGSHGHLPDLVARTSPPRIVGAPAALTARS